MPVERTNIACVTGASGMIGRAIVRRLQEKGCTVRVLAYGITPDIPDTQAFKGSLLDDDVLLSFLDGGDLVFHCAAELRNEAIMEEVNVKGTQNLMRMARRSNPAYFCHLSTVGVTGFTRDAIVTEDTPCDPLNMYESTKLAAERLVAEGIDNCSVVMLRPTNVINDDNPGALMMPIRNSWRDRCLVFVKGGESAHIIHAEDVAAAAIHFCASRFDKPERFIVSCDLDSRNTNAGLWSLYREYTMPAGDKAGPVPHLPVMVPHALRRIRHGRSNRGDIIYSPGKLHAAGFQFSLGVEGAVRRIVSRWRRSN